jgi:hypothetical protein
MIFARHMSIGAGWNHHGRIDSRECAALEQEDLAAGIADLLGRSANDAHRQADFIGDLRCGNGGPDCRRRDDVVSAGVSDPGQAVIFGAERDVQRACPGAGPKGGGQVANALLDREAGLVQTLAQPGTRLLFLEAELGMGVDTVTEADQPAAHRFKAFPRTGFRIHHDAPR